MFVKIFTSGELMKAWKSFPRARSMVDTSKISRDRVYSRLVDRYATRYLHDYRKHFYPDLIRFKCRSHMRVRS